MAVGACVSTWSNMTACQRHVTPSGRVGDLGRPTRYVDSCRIPHWSSKTRYHIELHMDSGHAQTNC